MEERRRQREQDEARRREEEEKEERRLLTERELLQRRYEEDTLRDKKKVRAQHIQNTLAHVFSNALTEHLLSSRSSSVSRPRRQTRTMETKHKRRHWNLKVSTCSITTMFLK